LKLVLLAPSKPISGRATRATVLELLVEGIDRACAQTGSASES
jgi:hypothetical protein